MTKKIELSVFSDILCVWSYVSEIRLDELRANMNDKINIHHHFVNIFGCTHNRIKEGWKDRGGYSAFGDYVISVGKDFPHVTIHPQVWKSVQPPSSASSHLFLKAVQILESKKEISSNTFSNDTNRTIFEELLWRIRSAFFQDIKDISQLSVLYKLDGSPTYLLNNGRQKLYGNVGYKVIEANIEELLERPEGMASWC